MFARFPFVDVAFGPGQVHKLAEFLTSDSITAQGFFEFEGFTGHLPAKRARRVPGLGADQRRLQLRVLVLHRARRRVGGRSAGRRMSSSPRCSDSPPTGCARSRCSARTSTPTAATCPARSACSFAELLARARRDRRDRADPLHEPASEGHARGRDPRARRASVAVRAHPPAASVGLEPGAQADAAHLHARALPRPGRDDPRARPRLRAHDRHHRRLPGRDRGGLRADAGGRRGGRLRRRVHVHLLAAPRDRGRDAARPDPARGQGRAAASGSSR